MSVVNKGSIANKVVGLQRVHVINKVSGMQTISIMLG